MKIRPKDFILHQNISSDDIDYQEAATLVEHINAAATLSEKCFTIFDYYKNEFYYISENTKFFRQLYSNNTRDYRVLYDSSDQEGVFLMHYIQKSGFMYLQNQPIHERTNLVFSMNVVMIVDGKKVDTYYRIKPHVLDKKGNLWLTIATLEEAKNFTKPQVRNIKTGEIKYFQAIGDGKFWIQEKKLSKQEVAILALMAEGKSTKEICETRQIKEPTFKRHRSEIYRKLGVESRINAINRAFVYGIIS